MSSQHRVKLRWIVVLPARAWMEPSSITNTCYLSPNPPPVRHLCLLMCSWEHAAVSGARTLLVGMEMDRLGSLTMHGVAAQTAVGTQRYNSRVIVTPCGASVSVHPSVTVWQWKWDVSTQACGPQGYTSELESDRRLSFRNPPCRPIK